MNSYTMAWAPAPLRAPVMNGSSGKAMGQQKPFAVAPVLGMLAAGVTAYAAGYLGWGLSRRGNNWGTFWYGVAMASVVKALHDGSNINW